MAGAELNHREDFHVQGRYENNDGEAKKWLVQGKIVMEFKSGQDCIYRGIVIVCVLMAAHRGKGML